jgi:hypothetical protein
MLKLVFLKVPSKALKGLQDVNSDPVALKRPYTKMYGDDRYRLSAVVDEEGRVVGARTSTIEEPACFARTLTECNEICPCPCSHPLEIAGSRQQGRK